MYVCVYVCMYVCLLVCMYVCLLVCMYVCLFVCMCMYVYVCMYVCFFVCMYVCLYVCMYVCMYVHIHIHTYIYMHICLCVINDHVRPTSWHMWLFVWQHHLNLNNWSWRTQTLKSCQASHPDHHPLNIRDLLSWGVTKRHCGATRRRWRKGSPEKKPKTFGGPPPPGGILCVKWLIPAPAAPPLYIGWFPLASGLRSLGSRSGRPARLRLAPAGFLLYRVPSPALRCFPRRRPRAAASRSSPAPFPGSNF